MLSFYLPRLARSAPLRIILYFFLLLSVLPPGLTFLFAAPLPKPYDALGQVVRLDWSMSVNPDFRLLVVDTFEKQRPWKARETTRPLNDVRFIYKSPSGEAFNRERQILDNLPLGVELGYEQSLLVHSAFELPGKESYLLIPREKLRLHGQLHSASLWVHSNMYLHRLFLLFVNADGRKVTVDAGLLNWHGWRRLSIKLPPSLFRRGRRATRRYTHFFTGFLIKSHPRQDAGDFALQFDNFLILSDFRELKGGGMEYQDSW